MQTPRTLLADPQSLLRSSRTTSTEPDQDRMERARKSIREVFKKLQASKGHKFTSMFPTVDVIREAETLWAMAIIENKLTPQMLGIGTHKAVTRNGFCPDLAEFLLLCKPTPADLGMPSVEAAYREACRNAHPAAMKAWSHKAVYHAATQVGMYELRSLEESVTRPMFDSAYSKTAEAILNGSDLPEIPKAIENQTGKQLTPEEKELARQRGRAALASLKAMFD